MLHDHTQTHHTRCDSSGRMISPTQRPLPDNTQQSQEKDIHVPGGIRTRNPSKPAAADPRLRPRSNWNKLKAKYRTKIFFFQSKSAGTVFNGQAVLLFPHQVSGVYSLHSSRYLHTAMLLVINDKESDIWYSSGRH